MKAVFAAVDDDSSIIVRMGQTSHRFSPTWQHVAPSCCYVPPQQTQTMNVITSSSRPATFIQKNPKQNDGKKKTRMYRSFKWPESNQWTCLIWLHQPNLLAKNFIEKKWTSAFHLLAKAPNFDSTKTKPASTTREVLIELTSSINR